MRFLVPYILLIFSQLGAQTTIEPILIDSIALQTDYFAGLDQHNNIYHVNENTLYKILEDTTINYQNFQLGKIAKVDPFNPLKIINYYKDLNSIIILDNRLAPIKTINFNENLNINNISHVASAYDNNLWLFDENTRELLIYNYKKENITSKSLPILKDVKQITSNYNHCWVLTNDSLMKYNYFASLEKIITEKDIMAFSVFNENILIQKKNSFKLLNKDSQKEIKVPFLNFKDYHLYQDYLYIYGQNYLYKYHLKF